MGELKGIYEIDGDDIRIAFTTSGDRPTDFDPKPGVFDNRLHRRVNGGGRELAAASPPANGR